MNKKLLTVGLIVILAVSIGIATTIYFQEQSNHEAKEANTYTIEGTLVYLPESLIVPGISVTTITPSVSPWPGNITFTNTGVPPPYSINATAYSFIYLQFSNKFKIGGNDFPVGFNQDNVVRISGQMSYSTFYGAYVMNATTITHIAS